MVLIKMEIITLNQQHSKAETLTNLNKSNDLILRNS
jgi:hypothetical protein